MNTRHIKLPDLLMERDELSATERSDRKIPDKYARPELPVVDEWLTQDVDGASVNFLFELVERRYAQKSTVLCTQYTPAEWHGRLGGGVRADAIIDRIVEGARFIDLGEVKVGRMTSRRKQQDHSTETADDRVRVNVSNVVRSHVLYLEYVHTCLESRLRY